MGLTNEGLNKEGQSKKRPMMSNGEMPEDDEMQMIEAETASLSEEVEKLEAANSINTLPSGMWRILPWVFGVLALTDIAQMTLTFFKALNLVYTLSSLLTIAEVTILYAFYRAMRNQKVPMKGLFKAYMTIEVLVLLFPITYLVSVGNPIANALVNAVLVLYFYPLTLAADVIAFIMSAKIISNYNGRLERIGWIMLVLSALNLIYIFGIVFYAIAFETKDVNMMFLIDGVCGVLQGAIQIYLFLEIVLLLRKPKLVEDIA
ncbi:MAG: hypothetical protein LKF31_07505 [Muribaculaceae bacterium]|nr:hypothetical protein [Muribaculaceae bacterium]